MDLSHSQLIKTRNLLIASLKERIDEWQKLKLAITSLWKSMTKDEWLRFKQSIEFISNYICKLSGLSIAIRLHLRQLKKTKSNIKSAQYQFNKK